MNALELPDIVFDGFNEADLRGEVIDPILRALGYRSGTENNILRERQIELRYPHIFLGRKKSSDPVLLGKPDYICEVRGFARWVVEAKSPDFDISIDDIEQAHSYAVHAEIRAPLFALCNGHTFLVFESARGPDAEPLLRLRYNELQAHPYVLLNLLSPFALRSRYPIHPIDLGKPLAVGFGSHARITGGFSRYDHVDSLLEGLPGGLPVPGMPSFDKLCGVEHAITGLLCFRDGQDGIVAEIEMPQMHELIRKVAQDLNIGVNRYVCRDDVISQDSTSPNVFEMTQHAVIPAGTETIDIMSWERTVTPVDLPFALYAEATGFLNGDEFIGRYDSRLLMSFDLPLLSFSLWLFMRGKFVVEIERSH